ncbi:tyrosine-type recombinase/integrase [Priestia megaterium]|jgi:integrase|uniref:site-specific integrase n=1 Tax=Priestia megaterium TaxID=1404 RepID=UPI002E1A8B6F|nr:tyrosine-type recombinase/integrase [Priestia megaterium]MED4292438.1 tyrosine-type recombinase/integrase [Priestia megaterium]MED4295117.1 tyrosine-type recombinase/integrase [Priestia megaterium]
MAYFRKVPSKKAKSGYTWSFTIETGVDQLTGKRKQTTRRGFATKKEAENAAKELSTQLENGLNIVDNKMTLNQFLPKWLEMAAKRKVRETTFDNYQRAVNVRILPILGHVGLTDLNGPVCQKFFNHLVDEGLSERYIKYIYTVLNGALEKAIDWDLLLKNPLRKVDIPRGRRRKYVVWTKEELIRFLQFSKIENVPYSALFFVCGYTGLRRGEMLALKWQDINFEKGTLHVQRNLIYREGNFSYGPLKTESSNRVIKLDDETLRVLSQHKKRQSELKLLYGPRYSQEDLIFCREDGQAIYPRTMTTIFNRVIKKAEVPKIRFHDLRHTHATLLLEAGVSLKEVQERLGHSSIKMTGDIYAHVTDEMKSNTSKKFSEYMQKNG